jgi:hypothetical protein
MISVCLSATVVVVRLQKERGREIQIMQLLQFPSNIYTAKLVHCEAQHGMKRKVFAFRFWVSGEIKVKIYARVLFGVRLIN